MKELEWREFIDGFHAIFEQFGPEIPFATDFLRDG